MKNRLTELFENKKNDILNIYFTAGHPRLDSTVSLIQMLDAAGVDLIEVGIPYSDPMADGTTIQESSALALGNGMTLSTLFSQIKEARISSEVPIILMGYFNQMLQFGIEEFLKRSNAAGVDGLIVPDLPMDIYESKYQRLFEKYNISISFLITHQTSDSRIQQADKLSSSFIYVVSQSSITGTSSDISDQQIAYFEKIKKANLETPRLIGFGIHDHATYTRACQYASGAIIGSAFIRAIAEEGSLETTVPAFVQGIRS